MKKLKIYRREANNTNTLIRVVNVSADFIGIGKDGKINNAEFKALALDLQADATSHTVD